MSVCTVNICLIWFILCIAPYVKVYLLHNGAYVAKKKTKIARKTLDPLYQQTLQFEESPQGKVLQVSHVVYLSIFNMSFNFAVDEAVERVFSEKMSFEGLRV